MSSPSTSWHRRKEFLAAVSASIVVIATFASIGISGTDTFFQQPTDQPEDQHAVPQIKKTGWKIVGNVSVKRGDVYELRAEY